MKRKERNGKKGKQEVKRGKERSKRRERKGGKEKKVPAGGRNWGRGSS